MRPPDAGLYLDKDRPINWSHPLNFGLVSEWAAVPLSGWWGGATLRDLVYGAKAINNGTLTGGVTWQPGGRPGGYGALAFDGVNGYVGSASSPAGLTGNPAFTLAGWFFFRDGVAAGLCGWGQTGSVGGAAGLWRGLRGTNVISAEFAGSRPAYVSTAISQSAWHHVALTKGPGAINATCKFYLDGDDMGALDAGSSGAAPNILAAPFSLGRWADLAASYANMLADDTLLLSRALSPAEVAAVYDQGRRGNPDRYNWRRPVTYFVPQTAAGGNGIFWGGVFASRIFGPGRVVAA